MFVCVSLAKRNSGTVQCLAGLLSNPGHLTVVLTVFDPLPPSVEHQVLQTPAGLSTVSQHLVTSVTSDQTVLLNKLGKGIELSSKIHNLI